MEIIRTNALTKYFGATPASDNISLHVKEGEIYGFLGLNGAGKTTVIRMLLGMVKPDNGNITLFEKQLTPQFDQWNDIGYLVETPYAYPNLSVTENLKVYYKLRQLTNPKLIDDIIEKLNLTSCKDKKTKVLSLGIVEVRELLRNLASKGSTIFLSSHILGEISKVANRMGIIHEGKLVKELTTKELTDQLIKKLVVTTADNTKAVQLLLDSNYKAELTDKEVIEITNSEAIANPENISKLLVGKDLPPKQVYLFTEDLEMYFLRTIRSQD
jgi:ABC-2 type transport system ATP-binding protein